MNYLADAESSLAGYESELAQFGQALAPVKPPVSSNRNLIIGGAALLLLLLLIVE